VSARKKKEKHTWSSPEKRPSWYNMGRKEERKQVPLGKPAEATVGRNEALPISRNRPRRGLSKEG